MMKARDYYRVLDVPKEATPTEIKQAYKQLALKYHPDKNQNKVESKHKFTELTEAYSVLADPKKRKDYDTYGVVDPDLGSFGDFEDFVEFSMFESFLDQFLGVNENCQLNKMFQKMTRGGKRSRVGRGVNVNSLFKGIFGQQIFGQAEQEGDEEQEEQDDEDLTEQEAAILQFGRLNVDPLKGSRVKCRFDGKKIDEDQVLLHFSEKHGTEFKQWLKSD